jgi:predicted amidophosphoribosyltransferase
MPRCAQPQGVAFVLGPSMPPMNPPGPLELVCPRCRIDVQPIRAAGRWFCPHCAGEFPADEVERAREKHGEPPGDHRHDSSDA